MERSFLPPAAYCCRTTSMRYARDLEAALAWHRRAAAAAADALAALPAGHWQEPLPASRWSAAQLTEHLTLAGGVVLEGLRGGPGMRPVLPWWQTLFLRATVLRNILAGRGFPRRAPAPRELRPGAAPRERTAALADLRRLCADTERALAAASPSVRVAHAYFGRLDPVQALKVLAAHLEHHVRVLEATALPRGDRR